MAKNTQEAEVIVTLNGDLAKKSLGELEKKYRDLEQAALDAYKSGNEALGKKLDKDVQKLKKSFEITKKETKAFEDVIKNINSSSLTDLNRVSKQLQQELKKLAPNTQEFIDKSKQLQQVNSRIATLKQGFKGVVEEQKRATLSMKSLSESFNKYFGIVSAGIASITGLSLAFRKAAQAAAELDDRYADVMKTTGLTHKEVEELDKALTNLDTRTSRDQLLLLARDAGKLGISGQEDIMGFVRAADQIQVALGEDLGEGAIRQLGKIADVLGYTADMGIEDALLSIGSAINAVGQASTASEGYLVEFSQRMAGVAAQANISAADLIGFASGLDQSAMKVEMASTAFQKFLMKMYEDPAQFARYAKMELADFTNLLQNDANKAITTVLQGLKDQDGFASLVPIFKDMGLDGARAVSVLASMATNLGAITEAQALANEEFEKATSVTEEYAVKNNNLQAQLEKARKEFTNATITLGQSLNPVLLKSTKGITYLIRALATYGKEIRNAMLAVAALTVVVKAHTIAQGLANAAIKIYNTLRATGTVIVNAAKLAFAKLTGATVAATAAQHALNAAMSASVFGVIALAIAGVTAAITHMVKKQREARTEAAYMEEINKRVADEYAEEASKVKALSNMVHNNTISLEKRREALAELKKLVPDYHANLTEEGRLINDNTKALDNYLKVLEMTTRAKILEEEYAAATAEVLKKEQALEDARVRSAQALANAGGNEETHTFRTGFNARTGESFTAVTGLTEYGKAQQEASEAAEELNAALDKQSKLMARISKESQVTPKSKGDNGGPKPDAPNEDEPLDDKAYKAAIQALEQQQREEQNLIKRSYIAGELTTEEYEQRLLDIKAEFLKKKYDLALANGKDTSAIEQQMLDQQISFDKAAYSKELKNLEAAQKQEENALKQARASRQMSERDYESNMTQLKMQFLQKRLELVRKYGLDDTAAQQAIIDAQIEAQEAAMSKLEKMKQDAQAVLDKLNPGSADARELESQLAALDELHEAKLLSEKEYEEAVAQLEQEYAEKNLRMKLEKAQDYIQKSQSFLNAAASFTGALQDAETAQLEAEYNERLAAAGNNAEERERIEQEYEAKKLETQKKYADVDMVINIARTIAAGALAAVQAFAQLGPIAGAVMAAVIAGTTAAEVATIIAQRNAIKNATVASSGGSGGSGAGAATGQRTVTGFSGGGYTPTDRSDSRAVGIVHANEWVAPAWMVRRNPGQFADLERYRRTGQHAHVRAAGFAEGGYTGNGKDATLKLDTTGLSAAVGAAVGQAMRENPVRSYVVRNDITELDNQDQRFNKQTSR